MTAERSRPLIRTIGHALAALILGAAFALACDGGHAAERATARAEAKSLPAKAPPRIDRKKKKPSLNFDYLSAKPEPPTRPYSADIASQHIGTLSLELAALAAVGITVGVYQWGWGENNFHVTQEGWFGKNTTYGGIDKLGHAWSAQLMSDYITWRLRSTGYNGYESSVTAALLTGIAFAGVELGDGFSHYGASPEDLIASASGIAFSFLRNNVPGLHDKVDFRMQYVPSGHGDFVGIGDYDGKKFLLAWKLGGFDAFKDTPLRYLEIHTGYYTRGFGDPAHVGSVEQSRTAYVGLGLNLSELLFSQPGLRDTTAGSVIRAFNKYIQLPYTYVSSDDNSGR
ncbi:MAG: DUF2279 domain-containing protein [Candidatus Binataceae bacterium]